MSNASDILTEPVNIVSSIPEGWNRRNLVDLCTPKQWKTISQNEMSKMGYPVFGANGFIGYYPEYNHENETIAITCRGATCGTVNLVPEKTYITGNSMCLDDVSRDTNVKYLYYASSYRTLSDVISGSAQPQITGESLRFVVLPIPPLAEQKKIASILSSVDEVIETTQKQIDKLQDLKKATMNELLTKGIGHTEFKDSELGRIPKSWEVVIGDEVLKLGGGVSPSEITFCSNGDVLFMKVEDFNNPQNYDSIKSTALSFQKDSNKKIKAYPQDTVVIAKRGAAILKNRVKLFSKVTSVDSNLMTIEMTRYHPKFFMYYLQWEDLSSLADTTSIPQLNNFHLYEHYFRMPPYKEQLQIVETVSAIDKKIETHRKKLSQTQSLKKSLMQDLLTGKVRVQVN